MSDALVYLETFAPAEKKVQFEERVQSLFETRWMIELVDSAMMKVREFPHNGNLHFEILSRCYLDKFKYTESDLLELLSMERSTYYDRKNKRYNAIQLTHLYIKDANRFKQVSKGNILVTKFKEFDVPSGVRNQYYNKNINGGKINLNDKSNVKLVSNRHLNKKQSDKIKLFANKPYK